MKRNKPTPAPPTTSVPTRRLKKHRAAKRATRRVACGPGTMSIDGSCRPIELAMTTLPGPGTSSACMGTEGLVDYSTTTESFTSGCLFDTNPFMNAIRGNAVMDPKALVRRLMVEK